MPDTATTKRERPATKTAAKKAAEAPKPVQTAESASRDMIGAQGPVVGGHDPLRALRAPFDAECIGKLPKGTCKACRDVARQYRACEAHSFVRRCLECGGSHSSATIHLDYVGHADLTQRLLDVDPTWTWEPFTQEQIMALPPVLRDAGLWINLTVLGITRPGFGDAQGKTGPNAVKEMIGDALRNAGMRFGIALDLWAKGDRSWAKAPDETPLSQVADVQAAPVQENSPQQDALEASSRHTRTDVLDDMTVDAMPKPDQRRWHVHMDTLTEGLNALHPEVLAEVKRTWPSDIPTPSSGRMTISQIKATREHMAMLAERFAAAQAKAAEQQADPTLPDGSDEPPF
jgi:uncharacterized coiled-coil protein SlyX